MWLLYWRHKDWDNTWGSRSMLRWWMGHKPFPGLHVLLWKWSYLMLLPLVFASSIHVNKLDDNGCICCTYVTSYDPCSCDPFWGTQSRANFNGWFIFNALCCEGGTLWCHKLHFYRRSNVILFYCCLLLLFPERNSLFACLCWELSSLWWASICSLEIQ